MPRKMQLELDSATWTESIITRAQRWAEDLSSKIHDEIIDDEEQKTSTKAA
jgi:hypothetical protein